MATPTVDCWRTANGVELWCPYCHKWHVHGDAGDKAAHCHTVNSPYKATGYVLVERPGPRPPTPRKGPRPRFSWAHHGWVHSVLA